MIREKCDEREEVVFEKEKRINEENEKETIGDRKGNDTQTYTTDDKDEGTRKEKMRVEEMRRGEREKRAGSNV